MSYANKFHRETYKSCQRTWDQIPVRFRYSPSCWEDRETSECLARTTVFLEYLSSVFQIHRIRRQENPEATKDLLDSSMQLLSVIIDLMKQWHRPEIRGQLEWLVCSIYSSRSTFLLYLRAYASGLHESNFHLPVFRVWYPCCRRPSYRSTALYYR